MLDRRALAFASELSWDMEHVDWHFPDWHVIVSDEYGNHVWNSAWIHEQDCIELCMLFQKIHDIASETSYEQGRMASE